MEKFQYLRCYQPEVTVSYDGAMIIEILAIVGRGVSTLIIMTMYHNDILVFGIPRNSIAGPSDLAVASLRWRRRVIEYDVVHKPVYEQLQYVFPRLILFYHLKSFTLEIM